MLKTEIFDILLHGEIHSCWESCCFLHGEIVVGEVAELGKLVIGEIVVGEIAVGEDVLGKL